MKIGIMQPYFLPYLGYYQLLKSVDKFIIYDNIKYTKKGWINRNRYLKNGEIDYFTIPLKKDSDYKDICDRYVSDEFDKKKILNKLKASYKTAPFFKDVYPLIEEIILKEEKNLFEYILNSLKRTMEYLDINTEIIISSKLEIDHSLKSQDKIMSICKLLGAQTYINPIGGISLYKKEEFEKNSINLKFLKMDESITYKQFDNEFEQYLSMLDVMMFNSKKTINEFMDEYILF